MAATQTMTQVTWAQDFLRRLGVPVSNTNITSVVAWQLAEGGHFSNSAKWNPLDTTLATPGSRPMNSVGVQSFPDYESGMQATLKTLQSGWTRHRYNTIYNVLKNEGGPQQLALAVGGTPWGSNPSTIIGSIGRAQKLVGNAQGQTTAATPATPSLQDRLNQFDKGTTKPGANAGEAAGSRDAPTPGSLPFVEGIAGAIPKVGNPLNTIGDLIQFVTDGKTWVRAGEVIFGALLVAGGLTVLVVVVGSKSTAATNPVLRTGKAVNDRVQVDQAERQVRQASGAAKGESTDLAVRRHQREQRSRYRELTVSDNF